MWWVSRELTAIPEANGDVFEVVLGSGLRLVDVSD